MVETKYDDLLRTAQELLQYSGYLDTAGMTEKNKVQGRFNSQRNALIYDLLSTGHDISSAKSSVSEDFVEIRADTGEYLIPIVDYVESELMTRIEKEAGKSPFRRRIARWGPLSIGIVVVLVYFGISFFSVVSIDEPIETRAGIEQRASAFKKAFRYDDLTNTRRRRWAAELLFWPVSPSETESRAAGDFVGLVLGGRTVLRDAKAICGAPEDGTAIGDADIKLVDSVAEDVRAENTRWLKPPAYTLLPPIQAAYRCR
jgi:hypothetical protein